MKTLRRNALVDPTASQPLRVKELKKMCRECRRRELWIEMWKKEKAAGVTGPHDFSVAMAQGSGALVVPLSFLHHQPDIFTLCM